MMQENFSSAETQEEWLSVFLAKFGDSSSAFCILWDLDVKCQTVAIYIKDNSFIDRIIQTKIIEDDMFHVNMFQNTANIAVE